MVVTTLGYQLDEGAVDGSILGAALRLILAIANLGEYLARH